MGGDHHVHDGLVPRGISHTASATRLSFEGIVRASQLSKHMFPHLEVCCSCCWQVRKTVRTCKRRGLGFLSGTLWQILIAQETCAFLDPMDPVTLTYAACP